MQCFRRQTRPGHIGLGTKGGSNPDPAPSPSSRSDPLGGVGAGFGLCYPKGPPVTRLNPRRIC